MAQETKKKSIKHERFVRLALTYFVVFIVSVIIIYPLVWTVGASLNPGNSLMSSSIIPENVSFEHYEDLFNGKTNYLIWYWNSLKISVATMVLTLIFVSFTAYSFSRFRFTGRKNGLMLFLLLQMIPQFSALIAIFVLSQMLGLVNSHLALILIYVGGMIPMNTYLMKGYLDAIPKDLDESARMDGAGHFRIFIEIIMPLSKPIIVYTLLTSFAGPFKDFMLAKVLCGSNQDYYTVAVGMYQMLDPEYIDQWFCSFAAAAVVISIPIAALFLKTQKYYVEGVSGAVKG